MRALTVVTKRDTHETKRDTFATDAWLAERGLTWEDPNAVVYGPHERDRFDYRDHTDPNDRTEHDRMASLMGADRDGQNHVKGGKWYTDARPVYGERPWSITAVGVGPVGTLGSYLGVIAVRPVNGTWEEDGWTILAASRAGTLAGTKSVTSRANGKKGGRPSKCGRCGTCRSCKQAARNRAKREAARDKATGRTIATTY